MSAKTRDILILQTGGTIDKQYPQKMGAYAFEIGDAACLKILARTVHNVPYRFEVICTKDSQEITNDDRDKMIRIIREATQEHVLITHGTDTLCDTANYLVQNGVGQEKCIDSRINNKVILLTGAFLPEGMKDSDADFNIGFALGILQTTDRAGVYVAIGGTVCEGSLVIRRSDGKFCERQHTCQ